MVEIVGVDDFIELESTVVQTVSHRPDSGGCSKNHSLHFDKLE